MPIFLQANRFLLAILAALIVTDIVLLLTGTIQPEHRIIDSTVVITFIGATAAEVSAIMIAAMTKLK